MKTLILFIALVISLYAKEISITNKTEDAENIYYTLSVSLNVGDSDSRLTLQKTSLEEAKHFVAEDIGTYTVSKQTSINLNSNSVYSDNARMFSPLASKSKIIEDSLDGATYNSKVSIVVNKKERDELLAKVQTYFNDEAKKYNKGEEKVVIKSNKIQNLDALADEINNKNTLKAIDNHIEKTQEEMLNEIKQTAKITTEYVGSDSVFMKPDEIAYKFRTTIEIDPLKTKEFLEKGACKDEDSFFKRNAKQTGRIVGLIILSPLVALFEASKYEKNNKYERFGDILYNIKYIDHHTTYLSDKLYICGNTNLVVQVSFGKGYERKFSLFAVDAFADKITIETTIEVNKDYDLLGSYILKQFNVGFL